MCLSTNGYEVFYNNLDADFIIFLSGCTASCASRYSYVKDAIPHVVIAASTVDATKMDEKKISTWVSKKVRDYFAGLEKPL